MSQISLHSVSLAFGGPKLLDEVSVDIHKGQRISLLGRNGAGKSTLLKVIADEVSADAGEVITAPGLKIASLPQDVPSTVEGTIYEIVATGAGKAGEELARLNKAIHNNESPQLIEKLQLTIEEAQGWHKSTLIDRAITQFELDGDTPYSSLSGGMRRKVFLARALAGEPDVLLLDEPTNHLDLDSIRRLEDYILNTHITLLFVTHDRRFLKRLATRIIELDRGKLYDWSCDYDTFLDRKQALLEAEEKEWELFDKKLAKEEVWIRRGIKARRTRNEGRVRALKRMREERKKRRQKSGTVSMQISESQRSGYKVIEAENISFSYNDTPVVKDFSTTVTRGDRIGIIGPNGCGKTTLLKLLLGQLEPQGGQLAVGTSVNPTYFDQLRNILDPDKTVWENVAPGGGDTVFVNGKAKHIISYLSDFLFTPQRAKSPVHQLSGGEKNRLMLARLFTEPSNLLIFDEPTNDLDAETLELLEELLLEFSGTILMVSHDREFLNNVVSSIIAYEGNGQFSEYIGGFDDWESQAKAKELQQKSAKPPKEKKGKSIKAAKKSSGLSYKEKRLLEALPMQIEEMESEYEKLCLAMSNPENCAKPGFIAESKKSLDKLQETISSSYKTWEELERRLEGSNT
ncbi:ATP-binding cassette domain-containing protein [Chitinispirillales bacterium ANBcel5]|uniref:ATP-binding cassette domain-containing protein n=1 Tax=Cellulosispirillum alkaliphilum TaxID=3039283 RepID=UPI002A51D23E|nr:ATP-binding cassette domain-containing protein [Chitinispirillales bacterium ANBcel5]